MNHLHIKSGLFQSSPIKANQGKSCYLFDVESSLWLEIGAQRRHYMEHRAYGANRILPRLTILVCLAAGLLFNGDG
jgi:hypothetical protein